MRISEGLEEIEGWEMDYNEIFKNKFKYKIKVYFFNFYLRFSEFELGVLGVCFVYVNFKIRISWFFRILKFESYWIKIILWEGLSFLII